MSHKHCAVGLLEITVKEMGIETRLTLEQIQESDGKTQIDTTVPKDDQERKLLGNKNNNKNNYFSYFLYSLPLLLL